jgi:hypothetical protein
MNIDIRAPESDRTSIEFNKFAGASAQVEQPALDRDSTAWVRWFALIERPVFDIVKL